MTFPIANKPGEKPTQPSQRELIEQAIAATVCEIIQLRRTLWLLLKQTGPMILDETQAHPLWRMKASRTDDGKTHLEALQLEEPTSFQLSKLADSLDGSMTPLQEAMDATDLKDYPPAYIQMRLQDRVVQNDTGYWVDATLHQMQTKPPTDQN